MASTSNSPQLPRGRSDSYDPGEMMPGAYPEGRNVEDENNSNTKESSDTSTHKLKDALRKVQGDGAAVRQKKPPMLAQATGNVPLSEHFGKNMKISGEPTTLPSFLHDEYYRPAIVDGQVAFVDDASGTRWCGESEAEARDHASDRARGGYVPGDGSVPVNRGYGEGDVAVGHGGVTYHRSGHGDVLPGYPTQEGMVKLIFDRIVDDQLRLAGADNPTSMPAAMSKSNNSSEGYPTTSATQSITNSQEGRTVPCQEKRTSPVSAPEATSQSQNLTFPPVVPMAIPKSTDSPSVVACSLPVESMKNEFAMQGDVSKSLQEEISPVHSPRAVKETSVSGSLTSRGDTFWDSNIGNKDSPVFEPSGRFEDAFGAVVRATNGKGHRRGVSDSVMGLEAGTNHARYLGKPI